MFAINQRNFRIYWLGGLLLFAAVVVAGAPLSVPGVPSGMGDHQAATTASNVNAIHAAWQAAGLLGTAKLAMVIDLIFIGIYSFGAFQGGQLFRKMPSAAMRRLGSVVTVACDCFFRDRLCRDNQSAYSAAPFFRLGYACGNCRICQADKDAGFPR